MPPKHLRYPHHTTVGRPGPASCSIHGGRPVQTGGPAISGN